MDYTERHDRLLKLAAGEFDEGAYACPEAFVRAANILRGLEAAGIAPPGLFLGDGYVFIEWSRHTRASVTKVVSVEVAATHSDAYWILTPDGRAQFEDTLDNDTVVEFAARALAGTTELPR